MEQRGDIHRGRPPHRMTIAKRKAMDYILRQEASGEPVTLGQMMRVCGFSCRSNAKRTLRGLREIGAI